MTNSPQEAYEYFGTYPNADAKALLDAFEEKGIRFDVAVDTAQLKGLTPLQASLGGTFGNSSGLAISVHSDDVDEAVRIRQRVLEGEAQPDEAESEPKQE